MLKIDFKLFHFLYYSRINNMDINDIQNFLNEFQMNNEVLYTSNSLNNFYNKWSVLIELITGVSINFAQTPLEKYALANTCAIIIRQRLHLTT